MLCKSMVGKSSQHLALSVSFYNRVYVYVLNTDCSQHEGENTYSLFSLILH